MTLEDHLGDVLRKGRTHAGLSLEDAARAAGLTPAALEALEDSGTVSGKPDLAGLARLLGLHPARVEALARGWQPAPVDLAQWRELRTITTPGRGMTVNAYLLWDEVTREAALFDTGFDAAPVVQMVDEHQLDVRYLFLTHGHIDHVVALEPLRQRFPKARVRSNAKSAPVDQRNRPNDCLSLGSLRITHRQTPGHAEDGVTYLVGNWPDDAPHVAIVGDALFAGSMGGVPRDAATARRIVIEQILSLPPETLLCPGHGPLTTVAGEKANNPFF